MGRNTKTKNINAHEMCMMCHKITLSTSPEMYFEGKCLERVRASFSSHRNFGLTYFWYLDTTEKIPLYYDIKKNSTDVVMNSGDTVTLCYSVTSYNVHTNTTHKFFYSALYVSVIHFDHPQLRR